MQIYRHGISHPQSTCEYACLALITDFMYFVARALLFIRSIAQHLRRNAQGSAQTIFVYTFRTRTPRRNVYLFLYMCVRVYKYIQCAYGMFGISLIYIIGYGIVQMTCAHSHEDVNQLNALENIKCTRVLYIYTCAMRMVHTHIHSYMPIVIGVNFTA